MDKPPGIAKFDSATAMLLALSRCLAGKDFAGLGQPRLLQLAVRHADRVPRRWRERIFAHMGASEAVERDAVDQVSTAAVAEWMAGRYPRRRYPAVMVGSSNGALVHLAAALRIPWLPQTFLTLVRQSQVHPDDAVHAMEAERQLAERFLAANPDSALHHLHDPCQDRLMVRLIAYYRSKYLRLPPAYRDFLREALVPGGTVYVVECGRRWPTTRLGERYVYQFGAVGGPSVDEYFEGGARVEEYLSRLGSPVRRWQPPPPDGESPEAEWGFAPALLDDIAEFARSHRLRMVRMRFDDPEDPSAPVAEFYRRRLAERGAEGGRLVVESFAMIEPYWVLRTRSVPYWMVFNMQPSLDRLHRYLSTTAVYDRLYLTLFAHGVDSVGLPPIDAWRGLFGRARHGGAFLGVDPEAYPAHFAAFGRYAQAIRDVAPHRPMPEALPLERAEAMLDDLKEPGGLRLEPMP